MGTGKLNVWVRDVNCNVIEKDAHLHVQNCHGKDVIRPFWFVKGHTEVDLPPGCYMVTAGVIGGNIYTDKTMVVIKCEEPTCVNLVLTKFRADNPPALLEQPITRYCPLLIALPTLYNANLVGLNKEEVHGALGVIAKAANMDLDTMLEFVRREVKMIQEHMKEFKEEERDEAEKMVGLLRKYL